MIQKQTYDIDEISKYPLPPVEVTEFNRNSKSIVIYRTQKENVYDPYIFYIQAMMKKNPDLDIKKFIQKDSFARPITESELFSRIENLLSSLDEQYDLKLNGEFVNAVEFEEEDFGTKFIIETTEEVVFFNWSEN